MSKNVSLESVEEPSVKDEMRKREEQISEKIKAYESDLSEHQTAYKTYVNAQTNAYRVSKKLLTLTKTGGVSAELDAEHSDLTDKLAETHDEAFYTTLRTLSSLQELYKMQVEYLAQLVRGYSSRLQDLEKN